MAIITFTSDFGWRDHYVAAVKAKMLRTNPNVTIVDISHEIEAFNIAHAAFVIGSIFRDFPQGTVHLVAVNSPGKVESRSVAIKLEEHYFIGPDNGLFSLLSEKQPSFIVEIQNDPVLSQNFPEKNILAQAAVSLASGRSLYDIGKQLHVLEKLISRQARISKNEMEGRVTHIDKYGNLITNIGREGFLLTCNQRQARIRVGRTVLEGISESYYNSEGGDCLCLFNSLGLLEIIVSQGNAAKLLGMKYDSPITINFLPLIE